MARSTLFHLLAGLALMAVLLVAGYGFFVLTSAGQAFDNQAYFGHAAVDRLAQTYDADLLQEVNKRALLCVAGAVFIFALLRRKFLLGFLAVAALGTAVIGAELLKHNLPRQELSAPSAPVPAYFKQDTYPSGHTTIGTSTALAFLLVAPALWRPWLAYLGGLLSASYATAVLFLGWHRPSDAFGGILWSGACFVGVAIVYLLIKKNQLPPGPPHRWALALSVAFALGSFAAAWMATGWLGPEFPDADFPFLGMTALIVFSAYLLTAWFAWALQHVGATHTRRGFGSR